MTKSSKATPSQYESTAADFTAPYRSYSSSQQLHAFDAELRENFKQMESPGYAKKDYVGKRKNPKKNAVAYDAKSVYTPTISSLENHLNDISDILSGTYSRTQKRDAWTWADRDAYVTQTVDSLTSEISAALQSKKITTNDAAALLDSAKAKLDIRFKSDKYVQSKIKEGKIDADLLSGAYQTLESAIKKYEKLDKNGVKYTPRQKAKVSYKKSPAVTQEINFLRKEGEKLVGELATSRQQTESAKARAVTETARADNLRAEYETAETELQEKTRALTAAQQELGAKNQQVQSLEGLLNAERTNSQVASERVSDVTAKLAEVEQKYFRLLASAAPGIVSPIESASSAPPVPVTQQTQGHDAPYVVASAPAASTTPEQPTSTLSKDIEALNAAEARASPTKLQKLGIAARALYARTQPLRSDAAQALRSTGTSIANAYRTSRRVTAQKCDAIANHPHFDKGAKYVAATALAAMALLYVIKNDKIQAREHLVIDDVIVATRTVQPQQEQVPVVVQAPVQQATVAVVPSTAKDNSFSLLNLSQLPQETIIHNYYFGDLKPLTPLAPADEKIVVTQKDLDQITNFPTGVDEHTPFPNQTIEIPADDGKLDLSPKAREQFRLLERRLDRVGVFSDGNRTSFGSVPYLRKLYKNHEANDFHAANFDTALSANATRDFTEKESLEMMIEKNAQIVATQISVPDSNNSEYADFTREAIEKKYLTTEQANRLEDLAEVNARTRVRRFLGIPFLPLPFTHTTDGRTRTVEVQHK